jgi:hypothetical protein
MAIRETSKGTKKRLYLFMLPSTLFFTLYVYATSEVTRVTTQPYEEDL